MIYTTYFANVKNLPDNIIPISICGKAPEWWKGLEYRKLGPKWSFFSKWKETGDNEYYIAHFKEEVLSKLTPSEVLRDIFNKVLSSNPSSDLSSITVALVCYEKPDDFCHRHLVSEWLNSAGIDCTEYLSDKKGNT